jgi:hypothetical protein
MYYDSRAGGLATRQLVRFGGQVLEGSSTPITENTPQNRRLFYDAFADWTFGQLERERRQLGTHHKKRIPAIPLRSLQQQVKTIAGGAISLGDLSPQQRANMINLAKLHTHLGTDFMTSLSKTYHQDPHYEKRHRGWQPRHKRRPDRSL